MRMVQVLSAALCLLAPALIASAQPPSDEQNESRSAATLSVATTAPDSADRATAGGSPFAMRAPDEFDAAETAAGSKGPAVSAEKKSVSGIPAIPDPAKPASKAAAVVSPKPVGAPPVAASAAIKPPVAAVLATMTTEKFLDKLMMAESGGRLDARNPRSTATGPFQFIESTFLDVVRRHFAQDVVGLTDPQVLTLRSDPVFARRAAEAFSRDNAVALVADGVPATFPNLRLAFLLGPTAAIRVLQAPPESPLGPLVGLPVIIANPFMAGLSASELAARAARDLSLPVPRTVARPRFVPPPRFAALPGVPPLGMQASPIARGAPSGSGALAAMRTQPAPRRAPALVVHCNQDLPSCRRWVAVQTRLLTARNPGGRRGLATAQR